MEEEAERVFQDERLLLREDEAASARDTMLVTIWIQLLPSVCI
jgi:hypothetical protein